MKVLHLCYSDIDGGAAKGAYGLHQALCKQGVESGMLVVAKQSDDDAVEQVEGNLRRYYYLRAGGWEQDLLKRFYPGLCGFISPSYLPSCLDRVINKSDCDLVHLHWVTAGMMTPESIARIKKPIVWTLRDEWPYTGGCHYASQCDGFKGACGKCVLLGSSKEHDWSRRLFMRKRATWRQANIKSVCLSRWGAERLKASGMQEGEAAVIPNSINSREYKALDSRCAREFLEMDPEALVVVFGAINPLEDRRKGFDELVEALACLEGRVPGRQVCLYVFGAAQGPQALPGTDRVFYQGVLSDRIRLNLLYASADVVVVPSLAESFGKTALEALCSGAPVVCFDTSGLRDIVEHEVVGYRAQCFDPVDLARGILYCVEDEERNRRMRQAARARAETEFSCEGVVQAYLNVYQDLLESQV